MTVGIPNTVLLVEAVYAVIFMMMLTLAQRNGGGRGDALWGLVWATRLFASLNGSRHLGGDPSELFMYLGLQACSGLSLILILARYERKVFKDRLMRRLLLHMTHVEVGPPTRSLRGTLAGKR
jgi:hypothetical protein